ncbi:MAG: hypothetical protein J4224_02705 [Candidatus Diapherotrites archaeon]|uniref:Uncharacterized protein n=1 Tax=Candidatus Iainarchaeum sp. TaxID=3101447 RepID=A0A7J4IYY9_9ARCH|nr:MAG: hypothetical protein QT03_C0001G1196 [archaeon GW2011_AR10]MBS3059313.1 hypothetical protein [Candidatus Diapherotrites archaeon]HIH08186.1 hypothetical protein [Candidatus Diapherotrites archaeon]
MNPKEEFIRFVQDNPSYYYIVQSGLFLELLNFICSAAKNTTDIYSHFAGIENSDVEEMLQVLLAAKLISRARGSDREIYYCTDAARTLIEKYNAAKKFMG